jgi:hypothetical protein
MSLQTTNSTAPLVVIVILAWNHIEETLSCLGSYSASRYANFSLIVADNGSTDGTADRIRDRFPDVRVIRTEENLGVSGGYNLGMRAAEAMNAEYVLITNNDVEVDPDMIGHLVSALETEPQAGMAMPKIFHYYGDRSRLWAPGAYWRQFPPAVKMGESISDGPAYVMQRAVEYATSCCLLIRRSILHAVGFFDTRYYFYYDDWDYSARVRAHGYSILFVPQSRLWHKISVTTQKSDKSATWWQTFGQSTVRFYLRHRTWVDLILFVGWFALRETAKLEWQRVPPFLRGVLTGVRKLRSEQALEAT